MTDNKPKWSRRKDLRPAEIIDAALHVFTEYGFAATKLDDIAKRAGIVKGTLYRYYDTKEDLFRAVVQHTIEVHLQTIQQVSASFQGSLAELIPVLLKYAATRISGSNVPALARLVISESHTFPDLARIWYENVVTHVLTLLTDLISKAQARGEVRMGDPKVHAFSIVGPLVLSALFHEMLGTSIVHIPSFSALAEQHAQTVLTGILVDPVRF
ncbi:TetR/AcrR family transcriptional regulator [Siphonobacter sp.]|uniref:TetR/AcrR family transcriptional regulator n=1 Tax=Siphonobacter sp. TaxID=1869184 RepID=UPI003B3B88F8